MVLPWRIPFFRLPLTCSQDEEISSVVFLLTCFSSRCASRGRRAYSHFVRPHASLRVALVQPRERGGKLLAQRYRQCTEALAAGRTNRRWTVREVLSYPLPPVPHFI